METVKVIINNKECVAEKGKFLIDIAKDNRIGIPHLCHHESLRGLNSCRLCIVEVTEGSRTRVVTSCTFPAMTDLIVQTNTDHIKKMRKVLMSLLVAETPDNVKIQKMAKAYGVADYSRYGMNKGNDCVMCGLCVKACEEVNCSAIATVNRGVTKKIATPYETASKDCVGCGSCSYVCPAECIKIEESGGIRKIWDKEFKLLKCGSCGKYYITEEQYNQLSNEHKVPQESLVCDCCKNDKYAKQMAKIFIK